jgi:hypothetical protein
MANNYTSLKLSYDTANRFKEDFSLDTSRSIKYLFLGNSSEYANSDTTIPDLYDTPAQEKEVWQSMFAAKRVTGNDVFLVIPRYNWQSNTKYTQFDDLLTIENLITANANSNSQPMYVMNSEGNIYKCICNNVGANSTIEPTGDFSTSNGFISTIDNYLWKYMYNVRSSNKFLTSEWIPAPTTNTQEYSMSTINIIDGALAKILVTNAGTGYTESIISAYDFAEGDTTLSIDVSNVIFGITNMTVEAPEFIPGTYITEINTTQNTIKLSQPTVSAGNGNIQLRTRISVDGDGNNDYAAVATLSNTGGIRKITVNTVGTNYSYGNVYIFGTGTGASARLVLPPKYGHGFNPARELGAKSVMVSKKIGEIDTTEGGIFSANVSFRQYGLFSSPHKYGENEKVTISTANNTVSQTYDVGVTPGDTYVLNEIVFQGIEINTASFSGVIHDQSPTQLRLINTRGTAVVGDILIGNTSGTTRAVSSVDQPEFERYSGDILYVKNIPKVQRTEGQAENIKFVINF